VTGGDAAGVGISRHRPRNERRDERASIVGVSEPADCEPDQLAELPAVSLDVGGDGGEKCELLLAGDEVGDPLLESADVAAFAVTGARCVRLDDPGE